jgi:hypothetical protein
MTLNLLILVATNIRSKFGPACDASQRPDGPLAGPDPLSGAPAGQTGD